ncbi:LamG-like jellyroll fold domain-containing protein, partial [Saccharicrinis sp. FJH2]|uniref:LamG domain-containing protein n=1 Tax=Saccharicrinis sp. FJH65 TaxID=3344659 RepID=UPI0035F435B1
MKTNSLLRYLMSLILFAGIFVSGNIKAQSVDATETFAPVKDTGIVYTSLTFVDGNNNGTYDCSFVLSEPAIAGWGDYSAAVAVYSDRLTVRNGGGWVDAGTVENLLVPVPGQVYHFWFDLDVTAKTYTTWVQTEGMAEPVKIFTDAAFRNTNISSILRWSALHNPDGESDTVKVLKVALVEAVGITGNYAVSLPGGADGNNSNVALPGFNLTDLPVTIEAWYYPMAKNDYGAVFYSRGTNNNGGVQYDKWTNNLTLRGIDAGGKAVVASNNPIFNAWNHVAYVVTATDMTIYINGVATVNNTDVPTLFTMEDGNFIGWDSAGVDRTIEGYFDEVRIWNTARSAQEIEDNKFSILNGDEAGLIAYYNFNDTAAGVATDLTANAYNGTINGGTYVESTYMDQTVAAPVISFSESIPVMFEKDIKRKFSLYITSTNTDAVLGVQVPAGFSATPSSLTPANFENGQAEIVIGVTTAAVGDSGSIVITFEDEGIDSLGVELVEPYQRYFFKEAESGLLLGSASTNDAQPALTDSMNVAAQHFILRPVNEGVNDSLYYIIQDVNYSYFSKKSSSGWSTKYGTLEEGVWKVVKGVTDYYSFMNTANNKYCGADGTAADSWYYADKTGAAVDSFMMIEAPKAVVPVVMEHSYTFEDGTAADVIGGADGEVVINDGGSGNIENGAFNAMGGSYIKLPAKDIALDSYDAISLEATVTTGANPGWTMLAYFGSADGNNSYWMSIARNDNVSKTSVDMLPSSSEVGVTGAEPGADEIHHYVSVLTNDSIKWYIDGVKIGSAVIPADYYISNISLDTALLCAGGYPDPQWIGSVHEFNIYEGELDAETVAAKAAAALKALGPKQVAYVQKSGKTVVATAADPYNDPIVEMLNADDNFEVTVIQLGA